MDGDEGERCYLTGMNLDTVPDKAAAEAPSEGLHQAGKAGHPPGETHNCIRSMTVVAASRKTHTVLCHQVAGEIAT